MPDKVLQDLNAELKRMNETIARIQEAGATRISGEDSSSGLVPLKSLRKERYAIIREIKQRMRKLAKVDTWGGRVSYEVSNQDY